jgi:hypothetical protein
VPGSTEDLNVPNENFEKIYKKICHESNESTNRRMMSFKKYYFSDMFSS